MNVLVHKIKSKNANIGIIGLGYVGLPLSLEFSKIGFNVIGIDVSENKINQIRRGKSYIIDVQDNMLKEVVRSGKLKIYSKYSYLKNTDCICITVPTPLSKTREPDLTFIKSSIDEIKSIIHKNMLIVLESTTYPGTTRELIANEIEKMGYTIGKDIFIAFSPERIDPGNKKYTTSNIPKVVGGLTKNCSCLAATLYQQIIEKVVILNSPEEAEMVKLLENTFRAVNIGLVNELAMMCDRMGIDIWQVIEAAKTKPFGFMAFYPGPGIGGHCIPLDPIYLSYKARSYNYYSRFIELATDINGNMPRFIVNKLIRILNFKSITLKEAKVLLVGITYKEDINDIRESPGVEILKLLEEYECKVDYYDPYVDNFNNKDEEKYYSIKLTEKNIRSYDCVVILVAHKKIDYNIILKNARSIFDTRNAFKNVVDQKITKF